MRISVVLPVYNEEKILAQSVRKLHTFLSTLNLDWQIIIMDNGSTDKTHSIGQSLELELPQVICWHMSDKGRGRALHQAWEKSDADVYAYCDIDLATNITHFREMFTSFQHGADICIGNRYATKGNCNVKRSTFRLLLSKGYNFLLRFIFPTRIKDFQCGFKAINHRTKQSIMPLARNNEWFFDTEILLWAEQSNYKIIQLPVNWQEQKQTKVKFIRTVSSHLFKMVQLRYRMLSEKSKNRLCLFVLFFLGASFFWSIIGDFTMIHSDEARHAENAIEILQTHDWATLRYGVNPDMYNTKFPLGAWLIALNYAIFGVSVWSLRIWSSLFAIGTAWVVFFFAKEMNNRKTGFLAALIMLFVPRLHTDHGALTGDYDAGLLFFICLSLYLFYIAFIKQRDKYFYGGVIIATVGVLYKSLIGFLAPTIWIVFLSLSGSLRYYLRRDIVIRSLLIISLILGPWIIIRSTDSDHFFRQMIIYDYFTRLSQPLENSAGAWHFQITNAFMSFFPWSLLLPTVLFWQLLQIKKKSKSLLLILWFIIIFILFSIPQTKHEWYILPLAPAVAIMTAQFLVYAWDYLKTLTTKRWPRILAISIFILFWAGNIFIIFDNYTIIRTFQNRFSHIITYVTDTYPEKKLFIDTSAYDQANTFILLRIRPNNYYVSQKNWDHLTNTIVISQSYKEISPSYTYNCAGQYQHSKFNWYDILICD